MGNMKALILGAEKPHIQRAQPYDGNGWICYGAGGDTQFGRTPQHAFRHWRAQFSDPDGAQMTSMIAAAYA